MFLRNWPVFFGLVFTLITSLSAAPVTVPKANEELSPDSRAAAIASTEFSWDLYRQLAAERQGNLFCSPYSVLGALVMAAEGARGETAEQLGDVLHMPAEWRRPTTADERPWDIGRMMRGLNGLQNSLAPQDNDAVRAQHKRLKEVEGNLKQVKAKIGKGFSPEELKFRQQEVQLVNEFNKLSQQLDQYEFNVANALWCDEKFSLAKSYQQVTQEGYGAKAHTVSFAKNSEAARVRINAWAGDQTKGLIREVLQPGSVNAETKMVLTNAVYFKGNWQTPFEKSQTKEEPFFVSADETMNVPLMSRSFLAGRFVELRPDGALNEPVKKPPPAGSRFRFVWELPENKDGWKLLELPYRGGHLSMVVILPNRVDGLVKLEQQLTAKNFGLWDKQMKQHHVHSFLPRFKLRNQLDLKSGLSSLGVSTAFQPGGFTGLSDSADARQLFIAGVLQQAYVDVSEDGTEAAAVTALPAPMAAFERDPDPPVPVFRADHPFVFVIRDSHSGAVIFIGRFTGKG